MHDLCAVVGYSLYIRRGSVTAGGIRAVETDSCGCWQYCDVWRMHSYFFLSMFFSAVRHSSTDNCNSWAFTFHDA